MSDWYVISCEWPEPHFTVISKLTVAHSYIDYLVDPCD